MAAAHAEGLVTAVKLYPAGATTNSASGVRDLSRVMPVLEKMAEIGLPLCIHGEVTTPEVDIFDREKVFLDTVLDPLRRDLPELKVTLEHITTSDGIGYVSNAPGDIAGTITTHHLMINRNHMLVGGIRPHYYCLPVAKRSTHQIALRKAATSGNPRFFLGTDSAPHTDETKGKRLRLRGRVLGHQHAVLPRPCLRGGRRARQAGRLRLAPWSCALSPAAERRPDHAGKNAPHPRTTRRRSTPARAPSPSSTRATRFYWHVIA